MNPETTRCMFLSSNCRRFSHEECPGAWDGLGIEVFCECLCHKETRENSSAKVQIWSNTVRSFENESLNVDCKESTVLPLGKRFGRLSPRTEVIEPGGDLIRPYP